DQIQVRERRPKRLLGRVVAQVLALGGDDELRRALGGADRRVPVAAAERHVERERELRVEVRRLAEAAEARIVRLVAEVAILALEREAARHADPVAQRLQDVDGEPGGVRQLVERYRAEALQRQARARLDRVGDLQLQQPRLGLDLVDARQEA